MNDESLSLGNPAEAETPASVEKNQEIPALILAAATDGHTIEQVHQGVQAAAESSGQTEHGSEPNETPKYNGTNIVSLADYRANKLASENIAAANQAESSPQKLAA